MSARLHDRIWRDFPEAEAARGVVGALRKLAVELGDSRQSTERLLAAAVFVADGDVNRFRSAIGLAGQDWRDLLVSGGVANGNWPDVLDEKLGRR